MDSICHLQKVYLFQITLAKVYLCRVQKIIPYFGHNPFKNAV